MANTTVQKMWREPWKWHQDVQTQDGVERDVGRVKHNVTKDENETKMKREVRRIQKPRQGESLNEGKKEARSTKNTPAS